LLIEKFKNYLRDSITKKGTKRSQASVNRFLEMLSKIFSLAIKYGETVNNPCREVPKLRLNNKRVRYLTDEEEPRLLEVLVGPRAHLLPMVIVAIGTGMRRGDQFGMRWDKIDFQRNMIYVPNSKTGREYCLPMSTRVREVLLELRRIGTSEFVFTNPETKQRVKEVKRAFNTACRLANIGNLHWHDLCHTFGTRLAEGGFSEATIAELMGHSDAKTTRRYTHGTEKGKRAAVESVKVGGGNACPIPAPETKRPPVPAAVSY
jgi:integrase